MPAEATMLRGPHEVRITATAVIAAGEIQQLPDGRAGYYPGLNAAVSGQRVNFLTDGQLTLPKASGVLLRGGRAYWDHSANTVVYKKVNDRDFYLGRIVDDCASGDTTCVVNLNRDPPYDLDLARDPCLSVLAGTAAAGAFGYPVRLGGANIFELTATNEAQKVDALGVDGFAIAANAIVEGAFRVLSDGGAGAQDFTIGVASGTHATDFQSVAEFVALHLDGDSTNINVQSDDGTTDVAPTDSTLDYTEGSAVAQRVEFWMDLRDPSDVQVYINGALVLGATVFTLAAGSGPLFLIVHLEKTATTDTYKVAVDWLRARYVEN